MPGQAKITESTRLAFGAGGIAIGVTYNGIAYFLLIYYNQVLGLDASLAGLALGIALLVDAVSDPFVGFLSDNWKSRLGRRHPFLYASALPITIVYFLLWHPPLASLGSTGLFAYLLVCIIALRLAITLFDIPSNALVPDLTTDYDERTRFLTYKTSASWFFGTAMTFVMYAFWLVPTDEQPVGVLNAEGYQQGGLVSALIIGTTILICAGGLHRHIPDLRPRASSASFTLGAFLRQFRGVLAVPSLRALLLSTLFSYLASGMTNALWVYLYSFFWGLESRQISMILAANVVGAGIAYFVFPRLAIGREKKRVAIVVGFISLGVGVAPIAFRLLGAFPANGTQALFSLLLFHGLLQVGLIVMSSSIFLSMTTDIVEQATLGGEARSEGIILSTQTFSWKASAAGGTFLAGLALSAIDFPTAGAFESIPQVTIGRLGLVYLLASVVLYTISISFIFLYRVSRSSHEAAVGRIGG